ncbi:hypothetical protein PN36_01960 [Candidatus Thiomargarita nelsonii]|uniref:Uncharacterized protein n=1 Tax=Candidatus Thiomargarita nelsonii TaxID=1003181 RepID=A0A4E0RL56_9GAMM|nr:hypothetical protein PN36_01960 [Candidatus Thiomargarita nelsonii]
MKVKMVSEQEVFCEAMEILLKHLSPSKMARLLATWQKGDADYLTIRDRLFEGETVDTLYNQVKEFESRR